MCKNGIIRELIRGLSNLVCEVIVLNTSKPFLLQTGHTISWPLLPLSQTPTTEFLSTDMYTTPPHAHDHILIEATHSGCRR